MRLPRRAQYAALALVTIALGLAVHRAESLPRGVRDVTGDALWGAMIAWWIGAIVPTARLRWRAAAALAVCYIVELSQLYHSPAIDALRRTTAGRLTLGSDFDPRDLLAYTAGVLAAALLERVTMSPRQ